MLQDELQNKAKLEDSEAAGESDKKENEVKEEGNKRNREYKVFSICKFLTILLISCNG